MSIVNAGINATAKLNSYFDGTPTYGSEPKTALDVSLDVTDAYVKKQFDYDGFERPFALVPTEINGQLSWKREALSYTGTHEGGYIEQHPVDFYELQDRNVDRSLVEKYGVALGMETNNGTVWLQEPGKNLIPQKDIY